MKYYIITDRSTANTRYYAGLNGWVSFVQNAIWYETEKEAANQVSLLKDEVLKIEEIEI